MAHVPQPHARERFANARQFLAGMDGDTVSQNLVREWLEIGAAAIGDAEAEIAQLKAQLDQYEGRKVFYTRAVIFDQHRQELTAAQAELEPGCVLRATDTGREETWDGTSWSPR